MRVGKKVKQIKSPKRRSQKVHEKPVEAPQWKRIPGAIPQPQPVIPSGV